MSVFQDAKIKTISILFLLLTIVGAILKIYLYDSARYSHCILESRKAFQVNTGTPTQEQMEVFEMCLDNLSIPDTLKLVFQKP